MISAKSNKILVSGGAGFIGQHLTKKLLKEGYSIRVLDNLSPQVHGQTPRCLEWLHDSDVDFIRESVTTIKAWKSALDGVDTVVHLAAETGTGQSMYNIDHYFRVNVQGTANMLHVLQNEKCAQSIKSVIVASSRAVYGEGSYECSEHGLVLPSSRSRIQMLSGDFELHCPYCKQVVCCVHTDEMIPLNPSSMYGLTKQVQEQMALMFARMHGINGFALRYQNVYGPGQSLRNPYTGILAVFSTLARQCQPIEVYEDGLESRDFVYVEDVVDATIRAIKFSGDFVGALNIGSGVATSVSTVANEISNYFDGHSPIRISGAFRIGDIRHNKASTIRAQSVLGFSSSVRFGDGIRRFLAWVETQQLEDKMSYERSVAELVSRGLMGKQSGG